MSPTTLCRFLFPVTGRKTPIIIIGRVKIVNVDCGVYRPDLVVFKREREGPEGDSRHV